MLHKDYPLNIMKTICLTYYSRIPILLKYSLKARIAAILLSIVFLHVFSSGLSAKNRVVHPNAWQIGQIVNITVPMAEKYYSTSNYIYCISSPILYIDKEDFIITDPPYLHSNNYYTLKAVDFQNNNPGHRVPS